MHAQALPQPSRATNNSATNNNMLLPQTPKSCLDRWSGSRQERDASNYCATTSTRQTHQPQAAAVVRQKSINNMVVSLTRTEPLQGSSTWQLVAPHRHLLCGRCGKRVLRYAPPPPCGNADRAPAAGASAGTCCFITPKIGCTGARGCEGSLTAAAISATSFAARCCRCCLSCCRNNRSC